MPVQAQLSFHAQIQLFGTAASPLPGALSGTPPELLQALSDQFDGVFGKGGDLGHAAMAPAFFVPPPSPCSPLGFAPGGDVDLGAAGPGASAHEPHLARLQGMRFERRLETDPFLRQQVEMRLGGRVVPDALPDGVLRVVPFAPGFDPTLGSSFSTAMGVFERMQHAAGPLGATVNGQSPLGMVGGLRRGASPFEGMMMNAMTRLLGGASVLPTPAGLGGLPPADPAQVLPMMFGGGGAAPMFGGGGAAPMFGAGGAAQAPFMPGTAGPTQGAFGLGKNDGSDVAGVLNDPSLTIEDKVTLMIMLIMKKMDQDIEKQSQEINKLQQQQNKQGGGGGGGGKGGGGGGGGAGGDKSIDVETMKLKRLIDKRGQMFDMLRQIIDKYNQTAKGIIDSIGR